MGKIMQQMQTARSVSQRNAKKTGHTSKMIRSDMKSLVTLGARAAGRFPKATPKPTGMKVDVKEVEKILGKPITDFGKFKNNQNSHYLHELGNLKQVAFGKTTARASHRKYQHAKHQKMRRM